MHRIEDYHKLTTYADLLRRVISNTLPKERPYYGLCHGDTHTGNMHIDESGKLTLFDFDCCGYGWRAYELAVYKWHQEITKRTETEDNTKQEQWHNFIQGYNSIRQLEPCEIDAIDLFVAIRYFWVMGIHASISAYIGSFFIDDNYYDHYINCIEKYIDKCKLC